MSKQNLEMKSKQLKRLLSDSLVEAISAEDVIGVLFSGGLDSSLTAAIVSTIHSEPFPLIVTGIETAKDIQLARESATYLNLPLTIRIFTQDDVKERLKEILLILGVTGVLQVELAIPLFFAAECARQFGVTKIISGQGADELFGGYARHERTFLQYGEQAVIVEIAADLRKLQQETLPFQEAIVQHFNLQLINPFLSEMMVAFSNELPFSFKISQSENSVIRKYLLRVLAKEIGFPSVISDAPKRAMQYGSGAHRILANLSAEYWSKTSPRITQKEARSHVRINQYLIQHIDE
ncbi:MAG: asparagine synthase C-terminal domain-containing protein [Candidatus Thorarchaeota archaeon]